MTNVNRQLGRRLAYARKLAELTQQQVANRMAEFGLGTTRDRVASAETGRRPIRADEVLAYAAICGKDPGWFYSEVDAANLADDASPVPGLVAQLNYPGVSGRFHPCASRARFVGSRRHSYRHRSASWVTGETCRGFATICSAVA